MFEKCDNDKRRPGEQMLPGGMRDFWAEWRELCRQSDTKQKLLREEQPVRRGVRSKQSPRK